MEGWSDPDHSQHAPWWTKVHAVWEGLHLHVVGGTASPLYGRGCHAVWEGSRPTLWVGLCDAVWEKTRSVWSEGRCPSSVGRVTSRSMRGVASRTVGGATPTQRGMALSHGVEGAASCSVGGAVTHCGQAGHVHAMRVGPCQHRVGQVSFWTDRKFWNSIEVLLAQRCECTKCH